MIRLADDTRPVPAEMLADAIETLTELRDAARAKQAQWAEKSARSGKYLPLREDLKASEYRCRATHLDIAIQAVTAALEAARLPVEHRHAA